METPGFLEKIASQFGTNASVKNVFGEPIQAGDKTIIPVAQVAYGLGGGFGQGSKKGKPQQLGENTPADMGKGEGAGGGGGMFARPKGVYEITPNSTRFIPAVDARQILMSIAFGFVLGKLLQRKKASKAK